MVFDLLPSSDGCIPQVSTSMLRVATARRWDRLAQPEMVTSRSAGRQSSRVAAAEGPGDVQRYVDSYVCIYIYINKILSIYIYIICVCDCVYVCTHACMCLLIKISLSGNGHSSRIKNYVANLSRPPCYLSRNACWATTPLMKIHSPPAKSQKMITDNFFTAL